jgi:acylphosphatase
MERVHLTITGRVQGVWYRDGPLGEAVRPGLVGWVRNLRDGRVEAVAEGPRPSLEALVRWCQRGPDLAWVEDVDADWQPASGEFRAFEVRPTSDRR